MYDERGARLDGRGKQNFSRFISWITGFMHTSADTAVCVHVLPGPCMTRAGRWWTAVATGPGRRHQLLPRPHYLTAAVQLGSLLSRHAWWLFAAVRCLQFHTLTTVAMCKLSSLLSRRAWWLFAAVRCLQFHTLTTVLGAAGQPAALLLLALHCVVLHAVPCSTLPRKGRLLVGTPGPLPMALQLLPWPGRLPKQRPTKHSSKGLVQSIRCWKEQVDET